MQITTQAIRKQYGSPTTPVAAASAPNPAECYCVGGALLLYMREHAPDHLPESACDIEDAFPTPDALIDLFEAARKANGAVIPGRAAREAIADSLVWSNDSGEYSRAWRALARALGDP